MANANHDTDLMKLFFCTKNLVAVALALATAVGTVSQAQPQPMPPPSAGSALPADIVPGSPLADVVKMLQAGVDVSTIKSYILNAQSAFNLDADKILYLKDRGAPSDLINAMMDRDKALYAATVTPPARRPRRHPSRREHRHSQHAGDGAATDDVTTGLFQRHADALRFVGGGRGLWPVLAADGGDL